MKPAVNPITFTTHAGSHHTLPAYPYMVSEDDIEENDSTMEERNPCNKEARTELR